MSSDDEASHVVRRNNRIRMLRADRSNSAHKSTRSTKSSKRSKSLVRPDLPVALRGNRA